MSNLLDMSRLQAGVLGVTLEPLAVEDVVAAGDRRARTAARARPRRVPGDPAASSWPTPALLERVLVNLIVNAVRFSPAGGQVVISASAYGEHVELRVVDRGPGIPPEAQERVFLPFQRLGDRQGVGLGLGLALSRGLTEAMGGTLTPEDTPGGGLTMIVSLRTGVLTGKGSLTRVLVVDDEPQILRALRINLRCHALRGGTSRPTAPPRCARPPTGIPTWSFSTWDCRTSTGWRSSRGCVAGRACRSSCSPAGRGSRDKVEALDAGADDYVTKPFGIDELLARIRAVTRRTGAAADEPATVRVGEHVIDLATKTVSGGVRLTPTEWHFLELLARNPGKLISQRQLLNEVWGSSYVKETHYLRQYMAQLRRKLERDPGIPHTC